MTIDAVKLPVFLIATALVAAQAWAEAGTPNKPAVRDLTARVDGDRAIVSFRLAGVLSEEVEERIHSGIPVTFRHKVEVLAKRGIPLMPARVLARSLIETRVTYDSLTRRYDLFRRIEHRTRQKKQTPLMEEQSRITDSLEEMRAWMTDQQGVPVFDPNRPLRGQKMRVRVEVSIGRHYILFIFPATLEVSAEVPLAG